MTTREEVEKRLREARREQLVHGHDWDVADVLPVVMEMLTEASLNQATWDEQKLRELFKPDRYGFCKDHKVWFDTVMKVHTTMEES